MLQQKSHRQEVFSLGCDKTTINEKSRDGSRNQLRAATKKDVDPHSLENYSVNYISIKKGYNASLNMYERVLEDLEF